MTLDGNVTMFAYPNGTTTDFKDETIKHLKSAGYESAVTTIRGVNRPGCDLFRLRRTGIYVTDSMSEIKMKLLFKSLIK